MISNFIYGATIFITRNILFKCLTFSDVEWNPDKRENSSGFLEHSLFHFPGSCTLVQPEDRRRNAVLPIASNNKDDPTHHCHPWAAIKVLWQLGTLLPDVFLQVKYLNTSPGITRIVIPTNHHHPTTIVDQSTSMTRPGSP